MQTGRTQTWRIYNTAALTAAASATTTSALDKRGYAVIGLIVPTIDSAAFTATVSSDNSTFHTLKDGAGTSVSFLTASTGSCAISGGSGFSALEPWPYVKFVFGAAQTSASRALTVVMQG